MSLPIHVDAYSGYKANERPRSFSVDEDLIEIIDVEDRWYEPTAMFFQVKAARVRTTEERRYILRYDEHADEWTLQSGFDGDELLARPSIELITVEPGAIRAAESMIAGCEACRGEAADHLFDAILADVLGKHGPFEFAMTGAAQCPNCRATMSEKTLVEPQGGIEVSVANDLSGGCSK